MVLLHKFEMISTGGHKVRSPTRVRWEMAANAAGNAWAPMVRNDANPLRVQTVIAWRLDGAMGFFDQSTTASISSRQLPSGSSTYTERLPSANSIRTTA
jgi:hypothetical protein